MNDNKEIKDFLSKGYEEGFSVEIDEDRLPNGLNEDVIKAISQKKNEPKWMTEWRLMAFKKWQEMTPPEWGNLNLPDINYQDISYFSAPKKQQVNSLDEVDPKILETYNRLKIPLEEQKILAGVAVDAVFDSVSVFTSFKDKLKELGVIFCSISEAMHDYPDLLKKYLGSVVSTRDNYFAALNAAVFSDGSFVYIPKGVRCPMELSTYFRINAIGTGQFERTLIIADEDSYVSYNEGCSAPQRDENQLHAAVVEIVALKNSEVKYSTIQNWYPGDENGKGGIYNLVTKRALCEGENSKVSWTQIETGSAITWKYPSCILKGDNSIGEFYSVALTNNHQEADTGTKMIHVGKNTKSLIISKGISAGRSKNTYRGMVKFNKSAEGARNSTECESLFMNDHCGSYTIPVIDVAGDNEVEHEATTSKINEEQLAYLQQRGLTEDQAKSLVVNGFCKDVLDKLPMEFSVEARTLLEINLEGAIG